MALNGINLKDLSQSWRTARETTMSNDAAQRACIEKSIADDITTKFGLLLEEIPTRCDNASCFASEKDWLVIANSIKVEFSSTDGSKVVYTFEATCTNCVDTIFTGDVCLPDGFSYGKVYSDAFYVHHDETCRDFLFNYCDMNFTIPLDAEPDFES